jgi:hypothetical protein
MGEEGIKKGGMAIHGNEYHDPDFEQEGVAAGLVGTHEVKTTGIHGVGGSTVESSSGAQSKVNTHEAKTTGIHGVGASTVESAAGAQGKVDTHEAKTTGVHGVGTDYVCGAKSSGIKARNFVKGWTLNTLLKGGGVDADPSEISSWEKIAETKLTSALAYIDFTGLDINTDKFYVLLSSLWNPGPAERGYRLYVNGDYTETHYYMQFFRFDDIFLYCGRFNVADMFSALATNTMAGISIITIDPGGCLMTMTTFTKSRSAGVCVQMQSTSSTVTFANITSLRLRTDDSSANIGTGSILTLCKPRTS